MGIPRVKKQVDYSSRSNLVASQLPNAAAPPLSTDCIGRWNGVPLQGQSK